MEHSYNDNNKKNIYSNRKQIFGFKDLKEGLKHIGVFLGEK